MLHDGRLGARQARSHCLPRTRFRCSYDAMRKSACIGDKNYSIPPFARCCSLDRCGSQCVACRACPCSLTDKPGPRFVEKRTWPDVGDCRTCQAVICLLCRPPALSFLLLCTLLVDDVRRRSWPSRSKAVRRVILAVLVPSICCRIPSPAIQGIGHECSVLFARCDSK